MRCPPAREKVLETRPDFVYSTFTSAYAPEAAGPRAELAELGVPAYLSRFACEDPATGEKAVSFDGIFAEVREIATLFGVAERGERLVADWRQRLGAVAKSPGTSVLWYYSGTRTPYVAGSGGLPAAINERLGLRNVYADAAQPWPAGSWEQIAARDPQVIVVADLTRGGDGDSVQSKIDFLRTNPVTAKLAAVRSGRFITVSGSSMDPSAHSGLPVQPLPPLSDSIVWDLRMPRVLLAGRRWTQPARILLAGVATAQLFSAVTSLIMVAGASPDSTRSTLFWLLGSLAAASWPAVGLCAALVAAALLACWTAAPALDAFAFGTDVAQTLGFAPARFRGLLFAVTALLTAALVAASGAIGFVGLTVPHAVRRLTGSRHRALLPMCALTGAVLLVWADTAARTVFAPQELPVGVVTALLGVPAFALLLRRTARS